MNTSVTANEFPFSLNILSEALQETFGGDMSSLSSQNSLPMLENVHNTNDVVQSGRTIKVDPLKVQYTK